MTVAKKGYAPRYPPTQTFEHTTGRGRLDASCAAVYVYDYLPVRVKHADDDKPALTASASLASDHVRLFGPGEESEAPILAS